MSEGKDHRGTVNKPKKKALIIGISQYNNLHSLDLCKNDAEELLSVLGEQDYEIPESRRLIGEVSYDTMRKAINSFFNNCNNSREDTLIFYFSGHGLPDGHGKHYLAPSDIDPIDPFEKGLDFESLEYLMNKKCNSDRIITILDCCFSGAAGLEGAKGEDDISVAKQARDAMELRMKASRGRCILASSLSDQQSVIKKGLGHSLFTYHLLAGLKGKEGYVNDYGYVTADCLSNYVFDRMLQEPNRPQIPIRKLEASGDLIVAHHPHLSKHEIDQVNSSYSSTASFVSNSAEINMKMMEAERYERNNDYDSAVSCYLEAIALDPNDYRPYNWKGDVLFKIEKNEEALKAYDGAITARPEHPDAYHRKGRVYFKLGDYDKALEYYDRASKIRPRSSEFLKDIGLALYELKEYEQAIKYFNQTLNLKPNQNEISEFKNLAARNLTETNELKKGMMLFDSGKYEDAIICFSKVLEINSNNIQTMRFKGLAMVKLSHFDEAISCFDEALKKDPTNNEIAKAKELAYEEQRQRKIPLLISNGSQYNKDNYCQNAIDSIEKTIKLGLENQSESNYKRNALYYLSKSKEPVASNTKGLTINPDDIHITNDEKCATRKLDKIGGPVSQDPTLPSWYHDKYSGSNSIIYQDHTSSLTSKLQKGGQIIHKLQKGGQIIHKLQKGGQIIHILKR